MKARLRRLGLALVVAAGVTAFGAWFARDLPRRQVERRLATLLEAEVHLGRLRLEGSQLVVLDRLELLRPAALPQLERLLVRRVEVRGRLTDLVRGRCERLRLDGFEAVLSPDPRPPRLSQPALAIALAEVVGGRVTLRCGHETVALQLDAVLRDLGDTASGEVRLRGPRLDTSALLLLAGRPYDAPLGALAEGLDATLRLGRGPDIQVELAADLVTLRRGERRLPLERPRLEATGTLAPDRVTVAAEPTVASLGSSRFEVVLARAPLRLEHLAARCSALDLEPWLALWGSLPVGVAVEGRAGVECTGSPADGFRTRVGVEHASVRTVLGSVDASGSVDGVFRPGDEGWGGPVTAEVSLLGAGDSRLDPLLPLRLETSGDLLVGARPCFQGRLAVVTATAGSLHAAGRVDLAETGRLDLSWSLDGAEVGRLAGLAAPAFAGARLPGLSGELTAQGTVAGETSAPALNGSVTVRRLQLGAASGEGTWSAAVSEARVDLRWDPASHLLHATLPSTPVILGTPPLERLDLVVEGQGEVDPAGGTFRVDRLELVAGDLVRARAAASGGRGRPLAATLHLELSDLERLRSVSRPLLDPVPRDLTLTGSLTAELEVAVAADRSWTATGPLALRGAGFASSDGGRVVEGLIGDLRLEAAGHDTTFHARAAGSAGSFQLLWGTFYADCATTRVGLELGLEADRTDPSQGAPWRGRVAATAPGDVRLEAGLEGRSGQPSAWWTRLEAPDLSAVLEALVRPTLAASAPVLSDLHVGGAVTVSLEGGLSSDGGSARGRLSLVGGRLSTSALQLDGLDLDLPVDLTWAGPADGGPAVVAGASREGSLRVTWASIRGVELATAAVPLTVEGDRLTLDEPLTLPLLGGDLELSDLALVDLLRPTRHLASGVELRRISLEALSRALDLPPLEGELGGVFPRVRLTPTALGVDGVGQLSLFGGTVEVRNISGREVLGSYPRLLFDARIRDLDLGLLTRTFDFGEVTGVLEGEVTGCELFRGVPLRFEGVLRSTPRPGVRQRISLKAVNNLAILGTGSGLGLLDRGLRRLISSYSYAAFGVDMRLAQDRFLLRGLEHRGDRELFLRGRYPLRLDVVNVFPGSTVSFRTMVERLRSLDFSRARTQP